MTFLWYLFSYTLLFIMGHFFGKYIMALIYYRKHLNEKHFCNKCECAYFESKDALKFKYCPYCGAQLDYFLLDERSQSYKGDE